MSFHELSLSVHGLASSFSSVDAATVLRADVMFRLSALCVDIERTNPAGARTSHPLFLLPHAASSTSSSLLEGLDAASSSMAVSVAVSVADNMLAMLLTDENEVENLDARIIRFSPHMSKRAFTSSVSVGHGVLLWDAVPLLDWAHGIVAAVEVMTTTMQGSGAVDVSLAKSHATPLPTGISYAQAAASPMASLPSPPMLLFLRNMTVGVSMGSQTLIFPVDAFKPIGQLRRMGGLGTKTDTGHTHTPLVVKFPLLQVLSVEVDKIDLSASDLHVFHHAVAVTSGGTVYLKTLGTANDTESVEKLVSQSSAWLQRYLQAEGSLNLIAPWSVELSLHLRALTIADAPYQVDMRMATKPLRVDFALAQARAMAVVFDMIQQNMNLFGSISLMASGSSVTPAHPHHQFHTAAPPFLPPVQATFVQPAPAPAAQRSMSTRVSTRAAHAAAPPTLPMHVAPPLVMASIAPVRSHSPSMFFSTVKCVY